VTEHVRWMLLVFDGSVIQLGHVVIVYWEIVVGGRKGHFSGIF
jgi:hypothetical protein